MSARLRRRRVPFVQQLAADDCGASCLAMVLGAHGVHDVAAECRRLCGSGRDGTRARRLVEIAARFGLSARTVAVEARELADHPRPAILHWRSSHFVVLERFHRGGVDVVDPAIGRVHLSMAEFLAGYSGVAILCEPAEGIVRTSRPSAPRWMDYLSAMFHDLRARGALAQIVAGSATLQAVGLTTPVFTKLVVDDVSSRDSTFPLAAIGVGMALVVAARGITAFTRSLVMLRLQTRLDARLTEGFFDHLLRLPYRFFQGRSSGDLLMRLSSNAMIRELLTAQLLAVLLDGPFAVVYLLVLLALAPSFALLVVALAIVQALLVLASLRPLRDLSQRALASKSDEQSCLVELMKGIVHLKAAGAERQAYERWQALFRRQLGVLIERGILTARIELALGTVRAGAPLVLLWYGASLVMAGHLGLGTMLALTAIAASFLTPFMSLVQNAQQLQLLDAYVERLADVLQADVETTQPLAGPAIGRRRLRGAIEARGLSFRFSPDGPLIVDDVSFAVDPGEQLGIVGPTGSGKSTILMLLLGLYRPTAGEVLFDGLPLPELDPGVVRRACGVVLQDVALFGGTIQANITLDAPGASASDVAEAARLAGLDADVLRMAMGYETRLSEDGTNLSGGQRQRVAIARALVERPDVLLLDEATSHLDVASEQRVIANLDALRCTRVVIAHRLTAVRAATRILVLEHGRVVERGRHDELLRREGTFAALAAQQGTLGGSRWPGTDLGLASARRMEHHGHRGWRASI